MVELLVDLSSSKLGAVIAVSHTTGKEVWSGTDPDHGAGIAVDGDLAYIPDQLRGNFSYDWDWAGAEAEYKRALELSPSDFLSHAWYADYLSKMGRHDEAVTEARRARQIEPVSVISNSILGMILYRARKYDEAIEACQRAIELEPGYPAALWFQALAHQQRREFSKAVAELRIAVSLSDAPLFRAALGHAYALAGDRAQALSILNELKALSKQRYVSPLDIAVVYTGLGERDCAFQWLEKACGDRTIRIQELPHPHFDSLRSDRRFQDLIRRIGLPLDESTSSAAVHSP